MDGHKDDKNSTKTTAFNGSSGVGLFESHTPFYLDHHGGVPARAFSPPPATTASPQPKGSLQRVKKVLNSSVGDLPVSAPAASPLWSFAVVRDVSSRFATDSIQDFYLSSVAQQQHNEEEKGIDLNLAKHQHHRYCSILADYIPNLVKLESDDSLPDCVFVEDTVVVIGSTAVITHPGHESRVKETEAVKEAFHKIRHITKIAEMQSPATLDGGDVLWTGRHLFVGLSKRTNAAGAQFLRETFAEQNITTIDIPIEGSLHLKSIVSNADSSTLISIDTDDGKKVVEKIHECTKDDPNPYRVICVPSGEDVAANVVRLDSSTLLVQGGSKFEETHRILRDALPSMKVITIEYSEFIKADGALTCCSVLF
eukprot:TRINITY_DN9970_c0_g1_i1.p1 TRINITY_DN9970_c0_g1~~TRINITY_DN9970_c0_g1_i1.p1  ORF type:complete len:368 (-),score=79.62 TRINITY_DN9970_c0_g1_i1:165-1268(-)